MANFLTRLMPAKYRKDAPVVPVVRLAGTIVAGTSPLRQQLNLASVAGMLEKAFAMKAAPAVAIVVNSPGGSPVQSRLIYQRIRDLAVEKGKTVHVFVEDAAASGGYMIACAGDDITADPSSIVGSIGVVSSGFGFVEALGKLGVERRLYTAGSNKAVLDPFSPEKAEDVERLKELQLDIHGVFIDLVKKARGARLSDHDELFTGAFWTGGRALELGLVDAIGDLRGSLRQRYGDKVTMKLMSSKRGLFGRGSLFGIGEQMVEAAMAQMDERALWSRIGLR
ncbi:S49 family peptidase [Rhizobiaceae bacterium]|nr:S49 family peptidase [Rhizobiaceae bacterium]